MGFAGSSYAQFGLFGPSDYDECIIEGMQGVQSDRAANFVADSCFKKFPVEENENAGEQLTSGELANIQLSDATWEKRYLGNEYDIDETIYNGNDFGIKSIIIKFTVSGPEIVNPFLEYVPAPLAKKPQPDGFKLDGIELHELNSFELMFAPYAFACVRAKSISTKSAETFPFPNNAVEWTHGVISAEKC